MGISDKAKELAVMIMKTKEFSELQQAKSLIDRNRELKVKVEDFKRREEVLLSGKLAANEAQQKAAELKKTFDSLSAVPEVDRFLRAEKGFRDMMQTVYKVINDSFRSSLNF